MISLPQCHSIRFDKAILNGLWRVCWDLISDSLRYSEKIFILLMYSTKNWLFSKDRLSALLTIRRHTRIVSKLKRLFLKDVDKFLQSFEFQFAVYFLQTFRNPVLSSPIYNEYDNRSLFVIKCLWFKLTVFFWFQSYTYHLCSKPFLRQTAWIPSKIRNRTNKE